MPKPEHTCVRCGEPIPQDRRYPHPSLCDSCEERHAKLKLEAIQEARAVEEREVPE